jgi:hypothetical protein
VHDSAPCAFLLGRPIRQLLVIVVRWFFFSANQNFQISRLFFKIEQIFKSEHFKKIIINKTLKN